RMTAMPDHDDLAAVVAHLGDFDVHFGDQRTRRVEYGETTGFRFGAHRLRDAMRAEHHRGTVRDGVELLDEHGTLALQIIDDKAVVDDLVAHVDRRAELRERLLYDRDRAVNAGAVSAPIGEQNVHQVT